MNRPQVISVGAQIQGHWPRTRQDVLDAIERRDPGLVFWETRSMAQVVGRHFTLDQLDAILGPRTVQLDVSGPNPWFPVWKLVVELRLGQPAQLKVA